MWIDNSCLPQCFQQCMHKPKVTELYYAYGYPPVAWCNMLAILWSILPVGWAKSNLLIRPMMVYNGTYMPQ